MIQRMIIIGLSVLVITSLAFSQKKKTSTIIGDIVDIKSYVMYKIIPNTPDLKSTVEANIASGYPLGIVQSKTGTIYLVVTENQQENANARLKDYLGMHVYVKGQIYQKGKIQLIVLSDIGKSIK